MEKKKNKDASNTSNTVNYKPQIIQFVETHKRSKTAWFVSINPKPTNTVTVTYPKKRKEKNLKQASLIKQKRSFFWTKKKVGFWSLPFLDPLSSRDFGLGYGASVKQIMIEMGLHSVTVIQRETLPTSSN